MRFKSIVRAVPNEVQIVKDSTGTFSLSCFEYISPKFCIVATWTGRSGQAKAYPLTGAFDSQRLSNEALLNGVECYRDKRANKFVQRAEAAGIVEVLV